jgi:CheY-like chemotaxis protein
MPLVLVVDDEFGIRDVLEDLLGDEGYRTASAPNGQVALEKMRAERPDLVLLDYMMPVMNGATVLERMLHSEALRTVPVVLMSASPTSVWRNLPAAAYLPKPFELSQVLDVIVRLAGPPEPK